MSLHKLTAGSGYDYLTRQVAAHGRHGEGPHRAGELLHREGRDPRRLGRLRHGRASTDWTPATSSPPTRCRACSAPGITRWPAERTTRARPTDRSPRRGRLPPRPSTRAATRLGTPYKVYENDVSAFRIEVAKRMSAFNEAAGLPGDWPVPAAERARIRTEVAREFFRAEHGREPADARELAATIAKHSRPKTNAVAGYDLTFSPVKSVSVLWAIADPNDRRGDRAGPPGRDQGRSGLHRDEGTVHPRGHQRRPPGQRPRPGRHRVHPPRLPRRRPRPAHPRRGREQGARPSDGKWLAIDGRLLFKANVSASETYNTALERHLSDALGRAVRGAPERGRPQAAGARDRRRRPRSERAGSPSAGSASRTAARSSLPTFQAHPRPTTRPRWRRCSWPSRRPWRPARPSTNRARWPSSARPGTARQSRSSARRAAAHADAPLRTATRPGRPPQTWPTRRGSPRPPTASWRRWRAARATWQYWHVYAEAQRQVRAAQRAHRPGRPGRRPAGRARSSTAARCSITQPLDNITEPAELRRVDGSSVYTDGRRPTCSPRARCSPPSSAWSPPPAAATGTPSTQSSRRPGAAGVDRQRRHPQRRTGHAGARDGHLRRPAAAGDRTRRIRQDHRDAGPGQRLDRRRRHRHRPRSLGRGRRRPALSMGSQIDTQTDTLAKLTHSLEQARGPAPRAGLGRRHRLLHPRGDRRGRHGRHPLPGRRGAPTSSSAAAASG